MEASDSAGASGVCTWRSERRNVTRGVSSLVGVLCTAGGGDVREQAGRWAPGQHGPRGASRLAGATYPFDRASHVARG